MEILLPIMLRGVHDRIIAVDGDDKRVCIMGASYGGYAALMGPIRHPGAYRCAISFAGVTDIELRYTAWGSDLSDQARRFSLPALMGDLDTETDLRVPSIKAPAATTVAQR